MGRSRESENRTSSDLTVEEPRVSGPLLSWSHPIPHVCRYREIARSGSLSQSDVARIVSEYCNRRAGSPQCLQGQSALDRRRVCEQRFGHMHRLTTDLTQYFLFTHSLEPHVIDLHLELHLLHRLSSARIRSVHRIIPDIRVQIDLILIPHRIGLQEPPQRRRVDPRLVVIHAELRYPCLARVLE